MLLFSLVFLFLIIFSWANSSNSEKSLVSPVLDMIWGNCIPSREVHNFCGWYESIMQKTLKITIRGFSFWEQQPRMWQLGFLYSFGWLPFPKIIRFINVNPIIKAVKFRVLLLTRFRVSFKHTLLVHGLFRNGFWA